MPFGFTKAPNVFQRVIQQFKPRVWPKFCVNLTGCGPNFVSVKINDILVLSRNFKEHLQHLQMVIQQLVKVWLKLKPSKCLFACSKVDYFTPEGHRTNTR